MLEVAAGAPKAATLAAQAEAAAAAAVLLPVLAQREPLIPVGAAAVVVG